MVDIDIPARCSSDRMVAAIIDGTRASRDKNVAGGPETSDRALQHLEVSLHTTIN